MTRILRLPTITPEVQELHKRLLSAEIVFELLLGHVPHTFGKLVWISSFRIDNSGEYRIPELDDAVSPEITDKALQRAHQRVFAQWLALGLEQQYEDLAQ